MLFEQCSPNVNNKKEAKVLITFVVFLLLTLFGLREVCEIKYAHISFCVTGGGGVRRF